MLRRASINNCLLALLAAICCIVAIDQRPASGAILNTGNDANNLTLGAEMKARSYYPNYDSDTDDQQQYYTPSSYVNNNLKSLNDGTMTILLTRNITYEPTDFPSSKVPATSYFGVIGIGTDQPQLFNVVFDTGSEETWVPYYTAWSYITANNLHYKTGYDCDTSKTCHKPYRKLEFNQWGTSISGQVIEDQITLFDMMTKEQALINIGDRLRLFDTSFIQAESASGDSDVTAEQFRYKPYDGVVGLRQSSTSRGGSSNLLYALRRALPNYNQRLGHQYSFGLWLNPNQQSTYGGELTLGGYDPNRVRSNFQFHYTRDPERWALNLRSVEFGNRRVGCIDGNCEASFETGINSIVGPRQEVQEIYEMLGISFDDNLKIAQIPCERVEDLPSLKIVFDNTPYVLPGPCYVRRFRYRDTEVCYLAIKPHNLRQNKWIMGTTFIGSFYTLFDQEQRTIGFAISS